MKETRSPLCDGLGGGGKRFTSISRDVRWNSLALMINKAEAFHRMEWWGWLGVHYNGISTCRAVRNDVGKRRWFLCAHSGDQPAASVLVHAVVGRTVDGRLENVARTCNAVEQLVACISDRLIIRGPGDSQFQE